MQPQSPNGSRQEASALPIMADFQPLQDGLRDTCNNINLALTIPLEQLAVNLMEHALANRWLKTLQAAQEEPDNTENAATSNPHCANTLHNGVMPAASPEGKLSMSDPFLPDPLQGREKETTQGLDGKRKPQGLQRAPTKRQRKTRTFQTLRLLNFAVLD